METIKRKVMEGQGVECCFTSNNCRIYFIILVHLILVIIKESDYPIVKILVKYV